MRGSKPETNRVILREIHEYDLELLTQAVEEAMEAFGATERIKPGMTVALKPNLVMKADPESGVITHPTLVAAVGLAVKKLGAEAVIAESSGGLHTPAAMNSIFSACGYREMAERFGLTLYTQCRHRQVEQPLAELCRSFSIIEPFLEADFIIDLPKFKSHCMTRFSGAVKNLFGVVPGLMKPELHCRFPEERDFVRMLVDLCETVRPHLSIMDGIDGMEGDGPTGGTKRHLGVFAASDSPYALDLVCSRIANMNPNEILFLKNAMDRGLCPESLEQVKLDGELERLIQRDFKQPRTKDVDFIARLPKFLRPAAKRVATPRPAIRKKDCVGCGKCAESCPRHTIRVEGKKAVIDYSGCIRCFCCHEMCPMRAVDVRRFSLFSL